MYTDCFFVISPNNQSNIRAHNTLHAGYFSSFCCRLVTFFKVIFFKKKIRENYQNVKLLGSRSRLTFPILDQTVCKSYQQTKNKHNFKLVLFVYMDLC